MPVCKKSDRLCVNTIYPLLRVIEMTNTYYALDTVGFVTEPAVIAERVLADYLSTNYSQSIIFFGSLKPTRFGIILIIYCCVPFGYETVSHFLFKNSVFQMSSETYTKILLTTNQ